MKRESEHKRQINVRQRNQYKIIRPNTDLHMQTMQDMPQNYKENAGETNHEINTKAELNPNNKEINTRSLPH